MNFCEKDREIGGLICLLQWIQGSSCPETRYGFPAKSISQVEIGFVRSLVLPTNDVLTFCHSGNRFPILRSSNMFTCPHGGFVLPQRLQVVRPTRVSCRYGTPITIAWRATRDISEQAFCSAGICSNTSAQKTTSNCLSGNCKLVTSPCTGNTRSN